MMRPSSTRDPLEERVVARSNRDLDRWQRVIDHAMVPFDIVPPADADFTGRARTRWIRDIGFTKLRTGAHTVRRDSATRRGADGRIIFSLVLGGSATVVGDRVRTVLRAGDLSVHRATSHGTVVCDADYRSLCLTAPAVRVDVSREQLPDGETVVIRRGDAVAGTIRGILTGLDETLPGLGERHRELALDRALAFVSVLLASRCRPGTPGVDPLLTRFERFIDQNLGDDDLDVTAIAAAHFVSARRVHQLFQRAGTTPAAAVRARRLDAARRALLEEEDALVWAIATRFGFRTASHFSALFRAEYGMSPGAYRAGGTGIATR